MYSLLIRDSDVDIFIELLAFSTKRNEIFRGLNIFSHTLQIFCKWAVLDMIKLPLEDFVKCVYFVYC